MEKRIYIVPVSKGWVVLSEDGNRLSGVYGSPNQALHIARPLAASKGVEIVIYAQAFSDMRNLRRMQKRTPKSTFRPA